MKRTILIGGLLCFLSTLLCAQELKVESFERLDRDLLARTSERLDRNDVPCAVLRVSVRDAQSFTFAGNIIGEVVYQPGEALVYLTDRSRKIQINSDKFGSLEYEFPERLAKSVRTLVMPLVGIGETLSYGVMVGVVRKWGGYVKAKYNFVNQSTSVNVNDNGSLEYSSSYTWFTGNDKASRFSVTAGAMFRIILPLYVYAGMGYGTKTLAWEMADGNWAEASEHSVQGIASEVGLIYRLQNFAISAGVENTQGKCWEANVGIAVMF